MGRENTTTITTLQQAHTSPFVVAVTGHCDLGDAETIAYAAQTFNQLLARLQAHHSEGVVALSGLGTGADTLFAQAAIARGIPLEVCIAAPDVIENFAPGPARELYLELRQQSRRVVELPYPRRTNGAYMALGYWLVDTCDLLIAAWNALPARALGGTADVVNYAQAQGCRVIHIHTVQRTTRALE